MKHHEEDDYWEHAKGGAKIGGGLGAVIGGAHTMATMPSMIPRGPGSLKRYLLMKAAQGVGGGVGGAIGGAAEGGSLGALIDLLRDHEK